MAACAFVVRFSAFATTRNHVQGAGRARLPKAVVYYMENDPPEECRLAAVMQDVAEDTSLPGPQSRRPPCPHRAGRSMCQVGWRMDQHTTLNCHAPGVRTKLGFADMCCHGSFRVLRCACSTSLTKLCLGSSIVDITVVLKMITLWLFSFLGLITVISFRSGSAGEDISRFGNVRCTGVCVVYVFCGRVFLDVLWTGGLVDGSVSWSVGRRVGGSIDGLVPSSID